MAETGSLEKNLASIFERSNERFNEWFDKRIADLLETIRLGSVNKGIQDRHDEASTARSRHILADPHIQSLEQTRNRDDDQCDYPGNSSTPDDHTPSVPTSDPFISLQETDGIEDYHRQFELNWSHVNLSENFLVGPYLAGLRADTQRNVRMFHPQSIHQCLLFGRLYERAHPPKQNPTIWSSSEIKSSIKRDYDARLEEGLVKKAILDPEQEQATEAYNAIHILDTTKNVIADHESGQSSMSQPFLSVTQLVSSTAQQDLPTAQPLLPNQRQLQFHPQEIRPTCNKHQDSSPDLWRADGQLLLCPEERYRPWPRTAIGPAALQCSEHLRVAEDPSQLPPPRGPERCDGEPAGNYTGLIRLAKLEFPRFDGAQVEEWIFKTEQFFKIDTTPNHLKVSISSIHLDGKAATWHQATLQTDPEVLYDWDRYRTLLIERFGELTEAPIAEFDHGWKIYDHVFGSNIEAALSNEETWKTRKRPRPIYSKGVLPESLTQQNGSIQNCSVTDGDSMVSIMPTLGLKNPQELWDLSQNSLVFIEALKLFFAKRNKEIGHLTFDKDDQLAVEFVNAAATTNAIIAGLIVIEAIKVLKKDENKYRMTYCLEHPSKKMVLMPIEPYEPNPAFYVTESSSESETENVESEDDDIKEVENPMMEWLGAKP